MENYKNWLGKKVEVKVDRRLGSRHPKYKDLIYEVNYGYIPGTKSIADNEEIDAYVLGVDKPIDKYSGIITAVIKRSTGDQEIKLIVTNGTIYTDEEINKLVDFQEKYFKSKIIK